MSDDTSLAEELEQMLADMIAVEAAARSQLHAAHPRRRFSDDYDLVGLTGEGRFAQDFRQPLDLSVKIDGDAGYDFIIPLRFTVDVKTYRKPNNLIHEQGKVKADIYVLAGYNEETARARLLGWERGVVLAQAPVRDFGYGVLNHYIAAEALRPMAALHERVMHLR